MKNQITIKNSTDVCHIDIEGIIGVPEEWQFEEPELRVATYERFSRSLEAIAKIENAQIIVNIRSSGGNVNDALLIHDALCSLDAQITTRCYGYAASAATIIAQAGSEGRREISSNALYLIHNSICAAEGNAAELTKRIELLTMTDERIASIYASRAGREVEPFKELMAQNSGEGRWLSPEEAVEAGLADAIIDIGERRGSAITQNIAKGWHRLLTALGISERDVAPVAHRVEASERSVAVQQQSLVALDEGQASAQPTRVEQCEDPAYAEAKLSANQRAYEDDIRSLRKR